MPALKVNIETNIDEANNLIKDSKLMFTEKASKYVICTQSIALLWKSYSFIESIRNDQICRYTRIKAQPNLATYQDYTIAMIPTDDEKITAFAILKCIFLNRRFIFRL